MLFTSPPVREDVFRQKVAFEITSTRYYSSFFGTFFSVTGSVIFTNGLKFFSVSKSFNIASFQVLIPLVSHGRKCH